MKSIFIRVALVVVSFGVTVDVSASPSRRKVIVDEDVGAPSDSNIQAISMLLTQREVEFVGVTTVLGDGPLVAGTQTVKDLLGAVHRRDIPVVQGAASPLVRTRREMAAWEEKFGKLSWKGAWNDPAGSVTEASHLALTADPAALFLVKQARAHPGEITLIALGPLTNIALACALDPEFAGNIRELVVAAGTFDQKTTALIGSNFNNFFDPEAARMVYRAPWRSLVVISPESMTAVRISPAMEQAVLAADTPLTRHLLRSPNPSREYPMWDEICVALWLDPTLATTRLDRYFDVELGQGAGYGNLLVWPPGKQPGFGEPRVQFVIDLDRARFERRFVDSITAALP